MPDSRLCDARRDDSVCCLGLDLPAGVCRRMAELGLRPGACMRVVSRTSGRGVIVSVGGARLALDAATAAKVSVGAYDVSAARSTAPVVIPA